MDLGVHLPLTNPQPRLRAVVETARECGFAAVSANDHLVFRGPWLDGPTALASVIEASEGMTLAMTAALPVVRGPVALAKSLAAIDLLSGGRLIAALAPGSSARDYELVGIPFEERWTRFDEALAVMRADLSRLWVASWGSPAGLRRVAKYGDGWLASAYNTTPERFAAAREQLPDGFPNALATMWTYVGDDGERVLREVLAPLIGRDPDELRDRVCVGHARPLRRAAGALRGGGLRAGLHLAAGRRAASARAHQRRRRLTQALDHRGDGGAVVGVARTRGADPPHRRPRGERAHLEAGQRMRGREPRDDRDAEPGRHERLDGRVVVGGERDLRREAGRPAGVAGDPEPRAVRRAADPRLVREVGQLERAPAAS